MMSQVRIAADAKSRGAGAVIALVTGFSVCGFSFHPGHRQALPHIDREPLVLFHGLKDTTQSYFAMILKYRP